MICMKQVIVYLLATVLQFGVKCNGDANYNIGTGISDITGPAAEVDMVCRWCKLILFQKTFNLYNYELLTSCYKIMKIASDFLFMNIPVFGNNLILNCTEKLSRAKNY